MDLISLKTDINTLSKDLSEINDDISKVISIDSLKEVSEAISSLSITIKDLCYNENTQTNLYYIWHRLNDNRSKLLNTTDYFNSLILNKLTTCNTSDKEVLNKSGPMISNAIGRTLIILYSMDKIKTKIDLILKDNYP